MSEPWVNITEAKIRTRLGGPEYAAVISGALVPGAESPLTQAIRAGVNEVRGYVRSCAQNSLGPDGYVPPELESEAFLLIVKDLSLRLPTGKLLMDENRQLAIDQAYRKLKSVQMCDFKITPPETPSVNSPIADAGGFGGATRINFNPYSNQTPSPYGNS